MADTQIIAEVATVMAGDVEVFYRSAGPPTAPMVVLLHGFPSSSHMFRNLIPLLATRYRVLAPDLPGFGFTRVPDNEQEYKYTFANLAHTFTAFVDALALTRFAVYIFDYGAPTALRFALARPDAIAAIVTQNGNAYAEGLGQPFWSQLEKLWASKSREDREALRPLLSLSATQWQYLDGSPHLAKALQPEALYLDQARMEWPGRQEIQLDLFQDYGSNVTLYPRFQEYLRESGVPVLAAWGRNDSIFVAAGAEAFARDVKKLETRWLDAGHFALETNERQMAEWMFDFFDKYEVFA